MTNTKYEAGNEPVLTQRDKDRTSMLQAAAERGMLTLFTATDKQGRHLAVLGIKSHQQNGTLAIAPVATLMREEVPTAEITPYFGEGIDYRVGFASTIPRDAVENVIKKIPTDDEVDKMKFDSEGERELLRNTARVMEAFTSHPTEELLHELDDLRDEALKRGYIPQDMRDASHEASRQYLKAFQEGLVPARDETEDFVIPVSIPGASPGDDIPTMSLSPLDHDCDACEARSSCPEKLQKAVAEMRKDPNSEASMAALTALAEEAFGPGAKPMRKN